VSGLSIVVDRDWGYPRRRAPETCDSTPARVAAERAFRRRSVAEHERACNGDGDILGVFAIMVAVMLGFLALLGRDATRRARECRARRRDRR
jgi:hypothetical protein